MRRMLQKIPWVYLLPVALVLGMMPVRPEPHLVEKLNMLVNGQLTRPIDVFDLFLHGGPLLLIFMKLIFGRPTPGGTGNNARD